MFIFRATVSAVSCLVVPAFICIHLLCSYYSKLNDDDDDDDDGSGLMILKLICILICNLILGTKDNASIHQVQLKWRLSPGLLYLSRSIQRT